MAGINKLKDLKIESELSAARASLRNGGKLKPKVLGDGAGLYLQISPTASASWLFRFMRHGKAKTLGLGGYPAVPLKTARSKAVELRELVANGNDPTIAERTMQAEKRLQQAQNKTFAECALEYIALQTPSWTNAKHVYQWRQTLTSYAFPFIGKLSIASVETEDIKKVLMPIWLTKIETSSRLRGRIESILDWARVQGWRTGDNPARLRGHLAHILPKRPKVPDGHHAAIAFAEMPEFIALVQQQEGMGKWALLFTILTACRTTEVLHAQWAEIDLDKNTWTIPAERMKANKTHRVPLSLQALDILKTVKPFSDERWIFPSSQRGRKTGGVVPMSNLSMMSVLRRMKRQDLTVHGMRSSFRDWVGETTEYSFEVAEAALAHTPQSKVVAAYARGDLFEKRARMMQEWANYATSNCNS